MAVFLKGVVIGFSIAAPVGPIGLLCLRRTLAEGRTAGFVTGLGAATADAVYGIVAALGLSAVTVFLVGHRSVIQFLGSLFLLWLGFSMLRRPPPAGATPVGAARPRSLATAYATTFVLTLANPATLISFIGVFAGLGVAARPGGFAPAAQLVGGVFAGSAAWWLLLSSSAGFFASKIGTRRRRLIPVFSGVLIIAFGVLGLVAASG